MHNSNDSSRVCWKLFCVFFFARVHAVNMMLMSNTNEEHEKKEETQQSENEMTKLI